MIVSGKITEYGTTDELIGANVYLSDANGNKGSNPIGAASDVNGNYTFDTQGSTLQYVSASFIGYKTVVKPISSTINFQLSESDTMLNEVVITPDGEEKQKPKWGRIALISGLSISAIVVGILLYKKYKK